MGKKKNEKKKKSSKFRNQGSTGEILSSVSFRQYSEVFDTKLKSCFRHFLLSEIF